MGKPKGEILLVKVFWRVFILEKGKKKLLDFTRAVSAERAVSNVWFRRVKPNYTEEDAGKLRRCMGAVRRKPRRKPRRENKHQPSLFK
jgi:hypothetical protein